MNAKTVVIHVLQKTLAGKCGALLTVQIRAAHDAGSRIERWDGFYVFIYFLASTVAKAHRRLT